MYTNDGTQTLILRGTNKTTVLIFKSLIVSIAYNLIFISITKSLTKVLTYSILH